MHLEHANRALLIYPDRRQIYFSWQQGRIIFVTLEFH